MTLSCKKGKIFIFVGASSMAPSFLPIVEVPNQSDGKVEESLWKT